MSAFLRAAWAVFWKDLLVERRAKEGAYALGFFAILSPLPAPISRSAR
jgi:hypothetical protein